MTESSNSSIAGLLNFICKRGDNFFREIEFYNDDAETEPTDITGDTFKLQVTTCNEVEILNFSIGSGLEITDTNKLTMGKTAAEMRKPAGTYKYDLQQTSSTGSVTTIMQGKFIIENDTTS